MSQRLKNTPKGECGYFLLGNVVRTGDPIVVLADKSVYHVTPPPSGELWVTLPGKASHLRAGDDVRVSLSQTNPPYRASVINIYRRDEGDNAAAKPSKTPPAQTDNRDLGSDRTKASHQPRSKTADKAKTEGAPKATTERPVLSKAETQFKLGLNMLANGKREAAIEYFDKALVADPSEAMAGRIAEALEGKPLKTPDSP